MKTPSYQITCTGNKKIANCIHEVRFTKPEGFTFEPGQFILLDCPLVENPEDIQPRAYSIASSPEEAGLLFVIKILEGGRASRYVSEVLKEGASMHMQGPLGIFTLDSNEKKDLLFLCTSTGIAPFRSQLCTFLKHGSLKQVDLIVSMYSQEDLFWVEEFQKLAQEYENFSFHVTLDEPPSDWDGHSGWVQKVAPTVVQNLSERSIYVCGSPAMVSAVKETALSEWGIAKEDVHMEGYI